MILIILKAIMNLKIFNLSILSLSIFLLHFFGCTKKGIDTRPNILFIMSDDHAYQAISAYSDRLISTPNIDRISDQGVLFTNACVTNSICAPSRATILTGKHSHINGKIDNQSEFDTTQITFPQLFQDAGYQTAMYGKLHFGNNPKGVDDFMILPGQGHYINPDFITNQGDTTIKGYVTDIITDLVLDWFEKKRIKNKPFLMFYLHKAPHRPWWPSPEKFKEYSKKKFPIPKTLFDDYSNRGTAAKSAEMNILYDLRYGHDSKIKPSTINNMEEIQPYVEPYDWGGLDGFTSSFMRCDQSQRDEYNVVLDSINLWFKNNWSSLDYKEKMIWKYQRYMQDYLGCISSVDDNVGRILDYLNKSGLSQNTIVVYTSDQGFYLGEHGWFDKRFIYDESFKTPLMIRWPEKIKKGLKVNQMVQNLDFAQTFLDAAGIDALDDMQGKSLMPLVLGGQEKWDRDAVYYHYYEYPSVHMVKRHYGIVTEEYKLAHFYYDVDEWELYDRGLDSDEMKNLYQDPKYQDIVSDLKKRLYKIRERYGDSRQLDQYFLKKYLSK